MMSGSSQVTKKPRTEFCSIANNEDRISNLPESLLCHILSRLPSKDAMRTSTLSKDWEFKWTIIYNIDIDDRRFIEEMRDKTSFVKFVNRLLFLSHELKSFRLSCREKYDCSHLAEWMTAVLRKNVESFELFAKDKHDLVLPRSLVSNTSLKKLVLKLPCTFKVLLDNYFPNLTHLHLIEVEIQSMLSNSNSLVFTFPVLKTFELMRCVWLNVNLVEIYSPSLSTFKCQTPQNDGVNGYSIKICGARLESFASDGGFPENITLYESEALNAAFRNMPVRDEEGSNFQSSLQVEKLLKGFSRVTCLQLSPWMCKVIARSTQNFYLPQFDRLHSLVIDLRCDAKPLFELLRSAPSLKVIALTAQSMEEFDSDKLDSVPGCVVSHLQEVKIRRTYGKTLIQLAKFFLKNGAELKSFEYGSLCSAEVVEQLSKLPRASARVTISSSHKKAIIILPIHVEKK